MAFIRSGRAACLLALYGVTLRCSCALLMPSVSISLRPLHATLRSKFAAEFRKIVVGEDSELYIAEREVHILARGLLDTHVLRCYAALLSEALHPLMTQLRESQREGQTERLSPHRRTVQALTDLLGEARDVLCFLQKTYATVDTLATQPTFKGRLALELSSSGLLEFWCRGVLLLAACEGQERVASDLVESFFCALHNMKTLIPEIGAVLSASPSLSLLLSAHLTQLAAALDGGTTYGLPPAAARWSAPRLAQLLPQGGRADGSSGAGGSRTRQGRHLDFSGATAAVLYLAGMALCVWSTALSEEASVKITSASHYIFSGLEDLMQGQSLSTEPVAAISTALAPPPADVPPAGAAAAPAPPPLPPRSLRHACNAHLHRLVRNQALGAAALAVVTKNTSAALNRSGHQADVTGLRLRLEELHTETRANVARMRRLADAADGPPLNAIAVVDVCLRLTVVSWEALLVGPHPSRARKQGQEGQQKEGLLRLSYFAGARMAKQALTCAKAACNLLSDLATRMELPRRAGQQLEDCWREWLAWASMKAGLRGPEAQRALEEWTWDEIGRLLAMEYTPACSAAAARSASTSPTVAAAIAAGYVPELEKLLRRLGKTDEFQCADLVATIVTFEGRAVGWEQLLAHAPYPDVTRLLTTLCQLVHRTANDLPPAAPAGAATAAEVSAPMLRQTVCTSVTAARFMACSDGLLLCHKSGGLARLYPTEMPAETAEAAVAVAAAVGWAEAAAGEARRGSVAGPSEGSAAVVCGSSGAEAGPGEAEQHGSGGEAAVVAAAGGGADFTALEAAVEAQLILSCVAVRMLPAYAELIRKLLLLHRYKACVQPTPFSGMVPVVLWIPVLSVLAADAGYAPAADAAGGLAAASDGVGPAAAQAWKSAAGAGAAMPVAAGSVGAGGAQDGGGSGSTEPGGGWVKVLLADVGVFSLLRDILTNLHAHGMRALSLFTDLLDPLHDAVVALAAFLPHHTAAVLQVTLAPARAAAADPRVGGAAARLGRTFGARMCLWDGLRWLFGPGGPLPRPELLVILHRLHGLGEDETLEDMVQRQLGVAGASASRPSDQSATAGAAAASASAAAASASDGAARASSIAVREPALRSWLEELERSRVLDGTKLAAWRDAAALLLPTPASAITALQLASAPAPAPAAVCGGQRTRPPPHH